MIDALEICRQAQSLGLTLEVESGDLLVSPTSKCPPGFIDTLREHKIELLAWLNRPPCPGWGAVPPAGLPLNPAMPHPIGDNRERVIGYLRRQGCDRPSRLTDWLVRRECAYYDGLGRHWDCGLHAYAAARDAACWQLNRSERDILDLLTGFDGCSRKVTNP